MRHKRGGQRFPFFATHEQALLLVSASKPENGLPGVLPDIGVFENIAIYGVL